jgi:hypothetical protein
MWVGDDTEEEIAWGSRREGEVCRVVEATIAKGAKLGGVEGQC